MVLRRAFSKPGVYFFKSATAHITCCLPSISALVRSRTSVGSISGLSDHAPKAAVALHKHCRSPCPGGGQGGRKPTRAAAYNENICLCHNGKNPCRLFDAFHSHCHSYSSGPEYLYFSAYLLKSHHVCA